MDHPLRASTLEALAVYIESQKSLITRAQADIERLRELREIDRPLVLQDISDRGISLGLGSLVNGIQDLPDTIEWSLYDSLDPTPFRELAYSASQKYMSRNEPAKTQRSELSALQLLVKSHRQTIVDPVLEEFALLSEPEELSEDEDISPEELRRQQEHAKIRELKKRKIHFGGLTIPFRDSAVYIRRDMEDESADVDMSVDDGNNNSLGLGEDDIRPSPPPIPPPKPRRGRLTKPSVIKSPRRKAKTPPPADYIQSASPEPQSATGSNGKRAGKPRPETYKQAWSDSEQHLLEKLLKDIPDGEKNRWVKISKAMDGRRTPRQVASRVQKYLEKLKRFGVDIGSNT